MNGAPTPRAGDADRERAAAELRDYFGACGPSERELGQRPEPRSPRGPGPAGGACGTPGGRTARSAELVGAAREQR